MIGSIQNYYNASSPCLDLCAPLQKYQEIFVTQNEGAAGFSKIALTIAWIVTGIVAYPIFGLLAAIGVAIKAATCQQLELDPVYMTTEELQVWGQLPSTTTVAWNDVQLERMNRFFAGVSAVPDDMLPEPVSVGTPYGPGGEWEGQPALLNTWCRLFGVYNPSEPTIETATGQIAVVVQTASASGERVKIRCKWTCYGHYDHSGHGVGFINCRKIVENEAQVDPIDMTDEQLQVWGQGDSVTTSDWNEVQMQRFVHVFDEGVRLAWEGKLMTSPIYQGPVTLQYPWAIGGPWAGEALYNQYDWCSLSGANASPREIAEVKQGVVQMLNEATEQGKRVELRSMYRVGGNLDQDNGGIIYINFRTIH